MYLARGSVSKWGGAEGEGLKGQLRNYLVMGSVSKGVGLRRGRSSSVIIWPGTPSVKRVWLGR